MAVIPIITAAEIFGEDEASYGEAEKWKEPKKQQHSSVDIGPFARFPNKLFGSGLANRPRPSATVLYLALCECANRERHKINSCSIRDNQLASETGLSPRTIRNVRTKLMENGLVKFEREPGQKYTYTLLVPELKWLKSSERPPRQKQKPRGRHAQQADEEA